MNTISPNVEAVFKTGLEVELFEAGEEVLSDHLRVTSIGIWYGCPQIEVESLKQEPGKVSYFAYTSHGWKYLFEDPMAGGLCFSQRAVSYILRPKPQS